MCRLSSVVWTLRGGICVDFGSGLRLMFNSLDMRILLVSTLINLVNARTGSFIVLENCKGYLPPPSPTIIRVICGTQSLFARILH